MALVHSSVIVTAAAVDTRTRDTLQFPFLARPQAFTLYVRILELDTLASGGATRGILQVGSFTGGVPRIVLFWAPTSYQWLYNNSISSVTAAVSSAAANTGDRIELRGTLTATGVAQLGLTINEGTETVSSATAARVLPVAWSAPNLLINAFDTTSQSAIAYRNIEIAAGVRTLQEMRIRAGTN